MAARTKEVFGMSSPNDRRYTSTHEWVKPDPDHNGWYKVGITAHRAGQLGTITSQNFNQGNGTNASATTTVCVVTGSSSDNVHAGMGGILRNERRRDAPSGLGHDARI